MVDSEKELRGAITGRVGKVRSRAFPVVVFAGIVAIMAAVLLLTDIGKAIFGG